MPHDSQLLLNIELERLGHQVEECGSHLLISTPATNSSWRSNADPRDCTLPPAGKFEPDFMDFHQRLLTMGPHPQLLFLDIETIGLRFDQPLFLIGYLEWSERAEGCVLRQLLARSAAEEAAILRTFMETVSGKTLVTFNGSEFDWPFLMERGRRLGQSTVFPAGHHDLLLRARTKYSRHLANFSLRTLENHLLGQLRPTDLAGHEIPRQYRQFARAYSENGGGASHLQPILLHNACDIISIISLFPYCVGKRR